MKELNKMTKHHMTIVLRQNIKLMKTNSEQKLDFWQLFRLPFSLHY